LGKLDFVLLGPILGEISPELVRQIKENTYAPVLLDPQGLLRQIDQGNVIHRLTAEFKVIAGLSTIIKANELETVVTGSTCNIQIKPSRPSPMALKSQWLYYDAGSLSMTAVERSSFRCL
jgi:hypothetical protein